MAARKRVNANEAHQASSQSRKIRPASSGKPRPAGRAQLRANDQDSQKTLPRDQEVQKRLDRSNAGRTSTER
jgi:hypothetical protein